MTATSVDDETVFAQVELIIEILETAAVYVSDEETGQSYIPGDLPQTMSFEVRNDGNSPDSFAMSLNIPNGMNAAFTNLINGNTPEIDIGASYNVSVQFSFVEGTEGSLNLQVIATSVADSSISATGEATYLVGSQDWLRIFAIPPVEVTEEGEVEVNVRIVNQYTTGQRVVMDLDTGESNAWFRSSIARLDKDFTLSTGETKEITITVDVTETTLKNLNDDTLTVNLTVWARSETVSDAANAVLEVTLVRMDSGVDATVDEAGLQLDVIAMWGVFILILVGGVVILLAILRTEEEEDEYAKWGEDGYEDSLTATYGAVAAAPSVPTSMPTPAAAPAPAPAAAPAPAPVEDSMALASRWSASRMDHGAMEALRPAVARPKPTVRRPPKPTLTKRRVQGAGNLANHAGGHSHVWKRTSTHLHLERRYTTNARSHSSIQQHRCSQSRGRRRSFNARAEGHGQDAR